MTSPLADRIADYASRLQFETLPARVVHEAKRRWIDSLGAAAGALDADAYAAARRCALRILGQPGAGLIGGGRTSPDWAAFVNGLAIRYLDFNDMYLSLEGAHPSDNLAAILAVGELAGAGGRDLIAATVLAYEIECRLCDAANLWARGWDHVTYLALSACAAACKLLRLEPARTAQAIAIAGAANTALRQTRVGELSMWKAGAAANASRNGVFAALLAAEGMTGPAPIFEGEFGLMNLVTGPFEMAHLGQDGADFRITEVYLKYWPAALHTQTAIEAALHLYKQLGDAAAIASIDIYTCEAIANILAREPEKWRPRTRETADHSPAYCTAVALVDGEFTPRQFTPARLTDKKLLDLVARTQVHGDARLNKRFPASIPNRVAVTLTDGRRLVGEVEFPRGHHYNPMTDANIEQKFRTLAEPRFGRERSDRILAACWELEKLKTTSELLDLMA